MSASLFDRLAAHAATFEKIAEKHRGHRYEEIAERGQQAHLLSTDIKKAMAAVLELDELRGMAKDRNISSELIGVRVRNSLDYT